MIYIKANEVTYLTIEDSLSLVSRIKSELKNNETAKDICTENGFRSGIIDAIVIKFDDIKTSAETINGEITLNNELTSEDFETMMRYAVHELVHVFQHMEREGTSGDPYSEYEYLDRPDEKAAFKAQVEYETDAKGREEAEEYVDELLDYHDVPDEQKENKRRELLGD